MNKKIFSVLVALLLALSCLLFPVNAADLPQDISREQIRTAITKADETVRDLLANESLGFDLSETVYSALISDETMNSIFTALYGAFSENIDTFRLVGVDISVYNTAKGLTKYPEVYNLLVTKKEWSAVFASPLNCHWGLTGKEDFIDAMAGLFRPFDELLSVLLCSGKTNGFISLQGADGYLNAVVPVLQAVDCPNILTQDNFTLQAGQDRSSMVKNILRMFFDAVDGLLESPVKGCCRVLPCVASFLSGGGISASFNALISPLVIRIGIIPFSGLDKLVERSGVFADPEGLGNMLENADMSSLSGFADGLTLPDIDLTVLAECTAKSENGYDTDEEAAFTVLLRFLIDTLKLNAESLTSSMDIGENEALSQAVKKLTDKSTDELTAAFIKLLNIKPEDAVQQYQWEAAPYTPSSVTYPEGLPRENMERVLTLIDSTLSEFMTEFMGEKPLSSTIAEAVYSEQTLNSLILGIYSALDGELSEMLSLIGLDASTCSAADALEKDFPDAAYQLRECENWDEVGQLDFELKTGKRKGFEKAINAVLTPLLSAADVLLCEGTLRVFDAIEIYGSDGYNTAVIPLLQALGCKAGSIKSYTQFRSLSPEKRTAAITSPVFDLLDEIIREPVAALCRLLPNIVYFIENDGIKTALQNLLYPVTLPFETLGLSDLLTEALPMEQEIDLSSLLSELTNGAELDFKLPEPDFKSVMSLGSAGQLPGKATYGGTEYAYTYITADSPAVLLTALRYVFDALSASGTNLFSGMMGGEGDESTDMFAMYSQNITKELEGKTTDELLVWLYNLLFAETPKREQEETNDFIPTVIYQPKKDHTKLAAGIVAAVIVCLIIGLVIFIAKHDFTKEKIKKVPRREEYTPAEPHAVGNSQKRNNRKNKKKEVSV